MDASLEYLHQDGLGKRFSITCDKEPIEACRRAVGLLISLPQAGPTPTAKRRFSGVLILSVRNIVMGLNLLGG